MPLPDYIDNETHTLEAVLSDIILKEKQTTLDIATGFFRIEAWMRLEQPFNSLQGLRLLIGRDPTILPAERERLDLLRYFRRDIQIQLEAEPFNTQYKQQIDRLIAYLEQEHIQARLFGASADVSLFLHAKAYIFDHFSIVGSSNFTPSGLSGNTELNLLNKIGAIARDLRTNWFTKFWNDPSVDRDYKTKLIDILNASKFGSKAYTPYQVFIKALHELFQEETEPDSTDRTSLELASFQKQGFEQAVRLLETHNACMVADAVGLGKTYIGLRLLDHYLTKDKRPGYIPRALIICPAQLRDLVWHKKLDEFGIKASIISQEELGRKEFDIKTHSRFDIILIDESHNFRNPNTNRYRNLQRLLGSGKRNKRIVLLTATPINNTIFDLYHQILLLTRNSETYYQEWGISNLKGYFRDLDKGKVQITELLFQTMVRRSRQDVIKRQSAGETIRIAGKEIRFPTRQLEKFTYNFEDSFQGLYAGIAQQIDKLSLAPYNIKAFKKKRNNEDNAQIKRNEALVALMKSLWLKRLESSLLAFENSITSQRNFQNEFNNCLVTGKLLDSKTFRKILASETDEDEKNSINDLINSLDPVNPKDYDTDQLNTQISADFHLLEDILAKLQQIHKIATPNNDSDRKLAEFKKLLLTLKGQKILVFSYFKDTAEYATAELKKDTQWLKAMTINNKPPVIECITGAIPGKKRGELVKRFAPLANCQSEEDLIACQADPIDILICTDVLSEGQNLQDAGVLINYDLHWNPVRMIQRAGRIDRLGTNFEQLLIYNCFPEQGLEALLGLVTRLQQRIITIDREVGLDASVLGELISDRSLEDLRRLKAADTDLEKAAILAELEQASDLVSLDEMRFPLLEFMTQMGREAAEDIPMGIHSTRTDGPKDLDGIFLAFRARNRHFWHFYPRLQGAISTDPKSELFIQDKRKIFQYLQCSPSDYPHPDTLPPAEFDNAIFAVLESATRNVFQNFRKQQSGKKIQPTLSKVLQKIHTALTQPNLLDHNPDLNALETKDTQEKILQVITTLTALKNYEKDIKAYWDKFIQSQNLLSLIEDLDTLFLDQNLYHEVDEAREPDILEIIKQEEIKLICYQWFKPK